LKSEFGRHVLQTRTPSIVREMPEQHELQFKTVSFINYNLLL